MLSPTCTDVIPPQYWTDVIQGDYGFHEILYGFYNPDQFSISEPKPFKLNFGKYDSNAFVIKSMS